MAIRSFGATRRIDHEQRSEERLPLWQYLRVQGRLPVQSVHLQAVQLLTAGSTSEGGSPLHIQRGHTFQGLTAWLNVMGIMAITATAAGIPSAPRPGDSPFWRGLVFAVPAGFVAAWPVNYWLLKRELKACH